MKNEQLTRDGEDHLFSLTVEPQMHEKVLFSHWETTHGPVRTNARIKVACPHFDGDVNACSVTLTLTVRDLKRHLRSVHGVADKDMDSYNPKLTLTK